MSARALDKPAEEGGRRGSPWWLLFFVIAIVELGGHAVIRSRVVPRDDWAAAARFVRAHDRPTDAIGIAPEWADPLLRRALGDRMSLREAGRSDLALFERLWTLSIRGHRSSEAPERPPAVDRHFGRVRVRRWDLGPSPVVFDLVDNLRQARVQRMTRSGRWHRCRWQRGRTSPGGLGGGALRPRGRFVCDPRRPWLWVGRTVNEDLSLQGRRCVWQHPQGERPIRVTFTDVPLGKRLVLYGGLYSEDERQERSGRPVQVDVYADGMPVGHMVHREGDGWQRMEARTQPAIESRRSSTRGRVSIEVRAPRPQHRSFCWSATIRKEGR